MAVKVGFKATDYQPINEVSIDYADDNWLEILEKNKELKDDILRVFLKNASSKNSNVYINRGKERNGENISLIKNFGKNLKDDYFTEKSAVDDIEDDGVDETENFTKEKQQEQEAERNAEKYMSTERINGVVGALSGVVKSDYLKVKLPENVDMPEEFSVNLQIKSRMDAENHSYFVAKLLTYGLVKTHSEYVYDSEDNIFDFLLIDIYVEKILEAIPKGYYRTYQRFTNNDDRLKGSIDIARHIRLNAGHDNGKIAYSFRENSVINSFNMLILATYDYLRIRYLDLVEQKIDSNLRIRFFLNDLRYEMQGYKAALQKVLTENIRPIAHPYYTEYEEVRKVCLKILREEGVSIFDTDSDKVQGFLFYLPDLWEIFLKRVMSEDQEEKGYFVFDQKSRKYIETNNSKNDVRVFACSSRPDFIFNSVNNPKKGTFLIMDAKFKEEWEKAIDSTAGKGRALSTYCGEDINKCIRDMVVFGTNGAGVIFPRKVQKQKSIEVKHERAISTFNNKQKFYILPFDIPYSEEVKSYSEWNTLFEQSVRNFKVELVTDVIEKAKKAMME
ncbi:MAG: 5-methylcytosine restriction system component-like protein [Herbinix sp.]|nr:5-methylcytosine restriction system component-like protein [Herbinix sp.]